MSPALAQILQGQTFMVSDERGDIEVRPEVPTGLFSFDTRFLSTWQLTLNGQPLTSLSVDDLQYYENRFFLVPGAATHYIDAKLSVIRHRYVTRSYVQERLSILNHQQEPTELSVRIEAGSDFADIMEVKGPPQKKGRYYTRIEDGRLCLGYEREKWRREAVISSTAPAQLDEHGLSFTVRIDPHGEWVTELRIDAVVMAADGRDFRATLPGLLGRSKPKVQQDLDEWLDQRPRLTCEHEELVKTYRRCLIDLAGLQFTPISYPTQMPAAGMPSFMAMIGRDSILTSLQALPFVPEFACTTLRMLGLLQGTRLDDFRDEEPGKILREYRYGETAAFEELPHSPYYGNADATPLYVILLDEYERWTGDTDLVRELEPEARAALNWIDEYADLMGNGYVWYQRRSAGTGLENLCWKESPKSICYGDGRVPALPRATCELQGYAYDAKMRGARLARLVWQDPAFGDRLEREAADLKERFNRDFWVEDGEFYALALDRDGRPVDSLASNMGHLLWSGIVEQSRAKRVAEHLVGPRLFSGWGVRTLAADHPRFNPIGYHTGAVWPFDNSFIAWGLRRYGLAQEAALVAEGTFDAAEYFQGRLPEALGGYHRTETMHPVQYPTASSPQAWSTGAPLLLLRVVLGLEPHEHHLAVSPELPSRLGRLELLDIPGRWGKVDAFARGQVDMSRNPQLRGESST